MTMSSGDLTLQEAAERLGVHYMTAYRYVRLGLLPARKAEGSWRVATTDVEAFRTGHETPTGRGDAPWSERLESRMIAGDVSGAWAVVEAALASGTEPVEVYTSILGPALVSIGERWQTGAVGIEDEHIATAVAIRIVGRLGPRFNRRGRPRGTVVAAMPAGERHGLALAMVSDVVRAGGYSVLDLGPDTPADSVVAALARADNVVAVVMSAVDTSSIPSLESTVEQIRSAGADLPIVVGGRAISSERQARAIGADAWADDLAALPELIATLAEEHRTA